MARRGRLHFDYGRDAFYNWGIELHNRHGHRRSTVADIPPRSSDGVRREPSSTARAITYIDGYSSLFKFLEIRRRLDHFVEAESTAVQFHRKEYNSFWRETCFIFTNSALFAAENAPNHNSRLPKHAGTESGDGGKAEIYGKC